MRLGGRKKTSSDWSDVDAGIFPGYKRRSTLAPSAPIYPGCEDGAEDCLFQPLQRKDADYFFFDDDFRDELDDFREPELFFDDEADAFFGTLPPALRASDKPMAIACFLLVTFLPEPPLFSVPRLRSCIAFSTFSDAFLPYFAIVADPFVWAISNRHLDASIVPVCEYQGSAKFR